MAFSQAFRYGVGDSANRLLGHLGAAHLAGPLGQLTAQLCIGPGQPDQALVSHHVSHRYLPAGLDLHR